MKFQIFIIQSDDAKHFNIYPLLSTIFAIIIIFKIALIY